MNELLLLLLGPSGVGKSTAKEYLETELGFESAPKYTTRPSRGTAEDERDFIFCRKQQFPSSDVLLFDSYGAQFGIQLARIRASFQSRRPHVIVVGNRATVDELKILFPDSVRTVLVYAEQNVLMDRLRRGVTRLTRLASVQRELDDIYGWLGSVDFILNNSGTIEETKESLRRIISMSTMSLTTSTLQSRILSESADPTRALAPGN